MGAVGPNHFVQVINSSVAIYNKTGTRLSHVSLDSFFTVTVGGTTYPRRRLRSPRALRSPQRPLVRLRPGAWEPRPDEQSHHPRCLPHERPHDRNVGQVRDSRGCAEQGGTTFFSDYDTLGTDDNGVYFGMRIFRSDNGSRAKIAATGKASLIAPSPSLGTVTQWDNITDMYSTPQPAHNHDAVSARAGPGLWLRRHPSTPT